jgi:hypothetical protein
MIPLDINSALAAEHQRDLRRQADTDRLAALLRCYHPAVWAQALHRVAASFSRPVRPGRAASVADCCTCP